MVFGWLKRKVFWVTIVIAATMAAKEANSQQLASAAPLKKIEKHIKASAPQTIELQKTTKTTIPEDITDSLQIMQKSAIKSIHNQEYKKAVNEARLMWLFGKKLGIKNQARDHIRLIVTEFFTAGTNHWIIDKDPKKAITTLEHGVFVAEKMGLNNRAEIVKKRIAKIKAKSNEKLAMK